MIQQALQFSTPTHRELTHEEAVLLGFLRHRVSFGSGASRYRRVLAGIDPARCSQRQFEAIQRFTTRFRGQILPHDIPPEFRRLLHPVAVSKALATTRWYLCTAQHRALRHDLSVCAVVRCAKDYGCPHYGWALARIRQGARQGILTIGENENYGQLFPKDGHDLTKWFGPWFKARLAEEALRKE